MLSIPHDEMARFEVKLAVKDAKGNLTGERKTLRTNSAHELAVFWFQNQPIRKKKKKVEDKKQLPKGRDAKKLLEDAAKYAEKVRNKKSQQSNNTDGPTK